MLQLPKCDKRWNSLMSLVLQSESDKKGPGSTLGGGVAEVCGVIPSLLQS